MLQSEKTINYVFLCKRSLKSKNKVKIKFKGFENLKFRKIFWKVN